MRDLQVRAGLDPYRDGYPIMVIDRSRDTRSVCVSLNMESIKPGDLYPDPPVKLDQKAAQLLMDDLWQCGLRPSEGAGSAGSLLATQNHLEDMRKIAFDLIPWVMKPKIQQERNDG